MLKKSFFGKKLTSGFQDIQYSCIINFLDAREPLTVTFQKETLGKQLIDHVCSSLDLAEKDYFGLRFVDKERQRHWLDPKKPAYRQLKGGGPMVLCFRVKYYPSDPFKLKEEITRYFLFLQLERDLLHGRLLCSQDEMTTLTSCLLQAKLGDFDEKMTKDELLKSNLLPKGVELDKVITSYKNLSHVPIITAEENFVREASQMDTYGVDPHPVKDSDGNAMYVGLSHTGIMTFKGNRKSNCFLWSDISRLDFEGKNFIINVLTRDLERKKKQIHSFKCPSVSACKHLWKCAVEQQCFFTLDSGDQAQKVRANKRLFRRSSTFKFSGLSESEVWLSTTSLNREEPIVQRSVSNPQFFRNSHGYETLPASFKIGSYNMTPGDSMESSSSSSLLLASRVNVNSSNQEETSQKSPSRLSNNDNHQASLDLDDEKTLRNNLEQVLEDDVEEAVEEDARREAMHEAPSESGTMTPATSDVTPIQEPDGGTVSSENVKMCKSSIHPCEENNPEFLDFVRDDSAIGASMPRDRYKGRSKTYNYFVVAVLFLLLAVVVYFVFPERNSILYSYPSRAIVLLRNALCRLGF